MIRAMRADDKEDVMSLAGELGLFPPDHLDQLRGMLDAHDPADAGTDFWLVDEEGGDLVGLAYIAPEAMTNATWNLLLIAVREAERRGGRGTALLRHVEEAVGERGGRLLIVETSGTDAFERTRAFYDKNGYASEARIRDFYDAGDDKIVYWKQMPSH